MVAAPGDHLWSRALPFKGPSQPSGQDMGFGVRHELLHNSYVTLDKLLDFFEPQFPHLYNGNDSGSFFLEFL